LSDAVPVTIGRASLSDDSRVAEVADPGAALGHGVAGMLRHLMAVLDREDRLEAGTGDWLTDFSADEPGRARAVRASVLRALRMAVDPVGFTILETLDGVAGRPTSELAKRAGIDQLSAAEMVSDLVSAGLAVKLPEAGQVAGTPAGSSIVELVRAATKAGMTDLEAGR